MIRQCKDILERFVVVNEMRDVSDMLYAFDIQKFVNITEEMALSQ